MLDDASQYYIIEKILFPIFRCFVMINPEKGSKAKKASGPHPKVLTLLKDISDHEWSV